MPLWLSAFLRKQNRTIEAHENAINKWKNEVILQVTFLKWFQTWRVFEAFFFDCSKFYMKEKQKELLLFHLLLSLAATHQHRQSSPLLRVIGLNHRSIHIEKNFPTVAIPVSNWQMQSSKLFIISSASSIVPLNLCCSSWNNKKCWWLSTLSEAPHCCNWVFLCEGSYQISLHKVGVQHLLHVMGLNFARLSEQVISLF